LGRLRRLFLPVFCLVATVGVEVLAHGWFFVRSAKVVETVRLPLFRLPDEGVTRLDLGDNIASRQLWYDVGEWMWVSVSRGKRVEVFRFEYEAGNPRFFVDVTGHSPENCMSSRGYDLEDRFADRVLKVEGAELVFESLSFRPDPNGKAMYAFKARWIANTGALSTTKTATDYRIELVTEGMRRPMGDALVVLASVTGCESEQEAWEYFSGSVFGTGTILERSD
jgi:hypothetical protein